MARADVRDGDGAEEAPMNPRGWIGVDFDSTLVECHEFLGPGEIGKPIPLMMDRVRGWLAGGINVRIVTARVSHNGTQQRMLNAAIARMAIRAFCLEHFGVALPVTCEKDYDMIELWDDRCVQVEANTGKIIGRSSRGFA